MNRNSKVSALTIATIILALGILSYAQDNQTNSTVSMPELKWMYGTIAQV